MREPDPQRNCLLPATSSPRPGVGSAGTSTGVRTFTVRFMPGLVVTAEVRELSRRQPGLSVEVLRTDWMNQVKVIRDGAVAVIPGPPCGQPARRQRELRRSSRRYF